MLDGGFQGLYQFVQLLDVQFLEFLGGFGQSQDAFVDRIDVCFCQILCCAF